MYIDNSVGDLKNDVWHKVVYDGIDTPMIYEMRKIKGIFLENLELNDFPVDVQVTHETTRSINVFIVFFYHSKDLSITISTTRTANEVLLVADTNQLSAINTRKINHSNEKMIV